MAPQPTVPRVAMFLLPSRTTALLAAAVPAETPSNTPISAALIVVLSIVRLVSHVTVPSKSAFPVTFRVPPRNVLPTNYKSPEPETELLSTTNRAALFVFSVIVFSSQSIKVSISSWLTTSPTAASPFHVLYAIYFILLGASSINSLKSIEASKI